MHQHSPGKPPKFQLLPMQQPHPQMPESTIKPFFSEDFEPFLDYIMLERRTTLNTTLHIPDSVKQNEVTAVVIRAGPGRPDASGKMMPMNCVVGDHVFIPVGIGYNLKIGDRHFTLANDNQIIGRFPKGDPASEPVTATAIENAA